MAMSTFNTIRITQLNYEINTLVIDAPQSGPKGLSQTLNKTIKMRFYAQVSDSAFVAKALSVSQE
jgi:hypothetical protein